MGKDLVIQALQHKDLERVPWIPFAGVHAGKLKGYNAIEVLTDEDKLFESLMEVHRLYMPDGMPIVFDLQLEAEILGCKLMWADYNPPSVTEHPYGAKDAGRPTDDMIPKKTEGRIPIVLNTMRRMKEAVGDDTALYGLICGPLTLASHLRGTRIFTDMRKNPENVDAFLDFTAKVGIAMTHYYLEAGMDVIAVVDPLVSQVSPKYFEQYMHEPFSRLFTEIRNMGSHSAFFVCGNASRQIDVMCKTNPDSIHIDENVDLAEAKKTTDSYNIALGGNIPLTTTMLFGNQQDNMKCVIDEYDAVNNTKRNFLLSPGCDMPYNVPVENTIAVTQAVLHPNETRTMLENYTAGDSFDLDSIEIPDYANRDKVLIELFTLDPDQCAACTYMVNSVADNYDEIKEDADYVVYRYCIKEDVARTMKMGLKNLPTMVIDGEPKFISIIPSKQELLDAVAEAKAKKCSE
ncbi:MAG: uroporphyrinogen decarboxylase family protein [Eggerthellaceae bacterium]|jgi:uroporphyrinogen decarboxylase|nr:uroporphyrinogen decarboxylase family protein [Eggerthellaceae bacterium]MCH4221349.1 uroporphyrinogen decarboxylase family protein [Eggerthellaceae bacterium]